jgi:hypothetical protein
MIKIDRQFKALDRDNLAAQGQPAFRPLTTRQAAVLDEFPASMYERALPIVAELPAFDQFRSTVSLEWMFNSFPPIAEGFAFELFAIADQWPPLRLSVSTTIPEHQSAVQARPPGAQWLHWRLPFWQVSEPIAGDVEKSVEALRDFLREWTTGVYAAAARLVGQKTCEWRVFRNGQKIWTARRWAFRLWGSQHEVNYGPVPSAPD